MFYKILKDFSEFFAFLFSGKLIEGIKIVLFLPYSLYELTKPLSTVAITTLIIIVVVARRRYLNRLPIHKVALPPYLENVGIYSELKIIRILRKIARRQGCKIKYVRENNGAIVVPDEQEEGEK